MVKCRNSAELCRACLLPPTFRTRRCRSPGVWHTVPCLANGYLVTSFLPGRHFSGPDDFSTQLQAWLKVVNRRVHRTLGARPADPWEADRAQMLTPPAVDPPTWWRFSTRMGRDHYVRVDTCDYSVGLAAIGHQVTVLTDSEGVVVLASGGEIVAQHARCWARHQTLT